MMRLDPEKYRRLLPLKDAIKDGFTSGNWLEHGVLTGLASEVRSHPRLLRSLSFGDDDYEEHTLTMLIAMAERDPNNLREIERYVAQKVDGVGGETLSSASGQPRIYITPQVFDVPDDPVDRFLVSVMMPFEASFSGVHKAIKGACSDAGLRCQRVDDIWEKSAVIQDIFSLICRSNIVVCDLTDRNPNVFYEAGIAHTLGKHVVPIAQHKRDVPFDLQHHRYLSYLDNDEGLGRLRVELASRLRTLSGNDVSSFSMS
jgi:hypothetical protein